mmetsp:Transcript_56900/g.112044  ORF Transcript_56900/g.112044 Transcript_56900/m.112044 type:complete len:330 (+) Transcript_56900:199-1188(+)
MSDLAAPPAHLPLHRPSGECRRAALSGKGPPRGKAVGRAAHRPWTLAKHRARTVRRWPESSRERFAQRAARSARAPPPRSTRRSAPVEGSCIQMHARRGRPRRPGSNALSQSPPPPHARGPSAHAISLYAQVGCSDVKTDGFGSCTKSCSSRRTVEEASRTTLIRIAKADDFGQLWPRPMEEAAHASRCAARKGGELQQGPGCAAKAAALAGRSRALAWPCHGPARGPRQLRGPRELLRARRLPRSSASVPGVCGLVFFSEAAPPPRPPNVQCARCSLRCRPHCRRWTRALACRGRCRGTRRRGSSLRPALRAGPAPTPQRTFCSRPGC